MQSKMRRVQGQKEHVQHFLQKIMTITMTMTVRIKRRSQSIFITINIRDQGHQYTLKSQGQVKIKATLISYDCQGQVKIKVINLYYDCRAQIAVKVTFLHHNSLNPHFTLRVLGLWLQSYIITVGVIWRSKKSYVNLCHYYTL